MPKKGSKKCPNCGKITLIKSEYSTCATCTNCGGHNCTAFLTVNDVHKKAGVIVDEVSSTEDITISELVEKWVFADKDMMYEYTTPASFFKAISKPKSTKNKEKKKETVYSSILVFRDGPLAGQRVQIAKPSIFKHQVWPPTEYQLPLPTQSGRMLPDRPELDEWGMHKPLDHKDIKPDKIKYKMHYYVVDGKHNPNGGFIGDVKVTAYYTAVGSTINLGPMPDIWKAYDNIRLTDWAEQTDEGEVTPDAFILEA